MYIYIYIYIYISTYIYIYIYTRGRVVQVGQIPAEDVLHDGEDGVGGGERRGQAQHDMHLKGGLGWWLVML